ncbi:lysophospholipid acyltransferase family protein [Alcanivorax quisquiliarum]|uniref:1-acyl-sn-glycerol-3-phosphate acyltransferase n=1 Tax=Alcanivorax quisquiliarum TaxID=2933565 RepID=A0ABT0E532_9GAMM|nr:lysophospholipid acyltransferase family protein [Alcanivorax quisquiliarum]MCK0536919.1 1-acyl-sn-glycerol-3-phosphate acyltransferase [Alcanivorax quisquiliarum]
MRNTSFNIQARSLLFVVLYYLMGIVHSIPCVLLAPFLNADQRYRFVNLWTRGVMLLLRHLNHVRIEVRGRENIPVGQPFVVMANHQSQWETFYLQLLFAPQTTVLKKELMRVPFFGWSVALLRPIAIDRRKPGEALKMILREGGQCLAAGTNVVIYPEGTRQAPGTTGRFNAGGALLACRAGVPILPVAHNAGNCWPARSLLRRPGIIILEIGPAISTQGRTPQAVNTDVESWIKARVDILAAQQ